jgi:hypothetical protein
VMPLQAGTDLAEDRSLGSDEGVYSPERDA